MGVELFHNLERLGTTPQGPTKYSRGEPLQFDAALTGTGHRWGSGRDGAPKATFLSHLERL